MRIGWIGLGAMGGPMAQRALERGHVVDGFDVGAEAVERAVRAGARAAASPADAARDAEALVVMVATPAQVEAVLFGPDGAAGALPVGSVVVLMATVGDGVVADWGSRLDERGVLLVDAPVSGGTARARAGELLVMASGAEAAIARVRTLLDDLAGHVAIVGDEPGSGQRVKLVNQLLCGVHIAAAAEALAFAESIGLDAGAVREVIRHGAAGSFMLDDRGERMLQDDPPVRSRVDIFVKDMGLVAEAARGAGQRVELAAAAFDLYREAAERGLGAVDDSRLIELFRSS